MQEINQLIEDYKRRIENVKNAISDRDVIQKDNLVIKLNCYKTFVSELEKIIKGDESI